MDITTVLGVLSMASIIVLGIATGELPAVLLNGHGLLIVISGTAAAMLINTPLAYFRDGFAALWEILRGEPYSAPQETITSIVALSENFQARGISALADADPTAMGGYVARAAQLAREYNNPDIVEQVLDNEIKVRFDHQAEVANMFRTMGVLAPMFGLVGTLIGIISVLKNISNPEDVGASMATAVTSALYGIVIANLFCVPVAGKLRARSWDEIKAKSMVADGIVMIMRGKVPLQIERKLRTYQTGPLGG